MRILNSRQDEDNVITICSEINLVNCPSERTSSNGSVHLPQIQEACPRTGTCRSIHTQQEGATAGMIARSRLRGIKPLSQRSGHMLLKSLEAIGNDELPCDGEEQTESTNCGGSFNTATRRDFPLQCQYGCRRCRPNVDSNVKKRHRCLER